MNEPISTETLCQIAVAALEDVKAKDIQVLDTKELTSLFEIMIVASGDSNRQVKALANNVREEVRKQGGEVIGMEGEVTGEWVLVDCGGLVVHVMQPAVRAYYKIEQLWGGETPISAAAMERPWSATEGGQA